MAKRKKDPSELFAIVRLGWSDDYSEVIFRAVDPEQDGRILGRPIAVYSSRAAAQARIEELEREARSTVNPFLFVGSDEYLLEDVTSLSLDEFTARLKKLLPKVKMPKAGKYGDRNWYTWWSKVADTLTDEQRTAVWELFDRLKFYGILKATMGG